MGSFVAEGKKITRGQSQTDNSEKAADVHAVLRKKGGKKQSLGETIEARHGCITTVRRKGTKLADFQARKLY